MNATKTLQRLRLAIKRIETHRRAFHATLASRIENDPRLSDDQLSKLSQHKLNHSEVSILSLVNKSGELAYSTLNEQVSFSQGMLSRYTNQLIKTDLLVKVSLPDNKKAYNLTITPTGRILAELHDQLHQEEDALYADVLDDFSGKEIKATLAVLEALAEAGGAEE